MALVALIGAALLPFAPKAAAAEPCAMMMAMPSVVNSSGGDDQSSDAMPVCETGMSCIVMAAVPPLCQPNSTSLVWAPVDYWVLLGALTGLSVPPDYSPPRGHA